MGMRVAAFSAAAQNGVNSSVQVGDGREGPEKYASEPQHTSVICRRDIVPVWRLFL